jgi:hypothetical protein
MGKATPTRHIMNHLQQEPARAMPAHLTGGTGGRAGCAHHVAAAYGCCCDDGSNVGLPFAKLLPNHEVTTEFCLCADPGTEVWNAPSCVL